MRAVTAKEHGAAQWVLDSLRSGHIRVDQFSMMTTCSRDHTEDRTVTACIGGWMFLYMQGAHEKTSAHDVLEAQVYVHSIECGHLGREKSPLYDLCYPPCGTRNATRDGAIVALRAFLATDIPIWPEAAHA